jgi:hypothetical protein
MDYTIRVLQKCKEHGFKVFMDPHADVVSPFHLIYPLPMFILSSGPVSPVAPVHLTGRSLPVA